MAQKYDREKAKMYYEKNKERYKRYYAENKEKIKKYREANMDSVRSNAKKCAKKPEWRWKKYKEGAKERNIKFCLTFEEFKTFWQKSCHYCGDEIETIGLDRINNNIGYQIDNIVSCCSICNRMKMKDTSEKFIEQCKKIATKQKQR